MLITIITCDYRKEEITNSSKMVTLEGFEQNGAGGNTSSRAFKKEVLSIQRLLLSFYDRISRKRGV